GGVIADREHDAGRRREQAGPEIGASDRAPGAYAHRLGGAETRSDQKQITAEGGQREDELAEGGDAEKHRELHWYPGNAALEAPVARSRRRIDGAVGGKGFRDPIDQRQRGNADDDGIGPQPTDQEPLQRVAQSREGERSDEPEGEAAPIDRKDEDHRGGANERAERERHDVSADGDQCHPDRDTADEGDGGQQRKNA